MNAIMATYFKDYKKAEKCCEEKNKIWRWGRKDKENRFVILEVSNGFFVVSKKQLEITL